MNFLDSTDNGTVSQYEIDVLNSVFKEDTDVHKVMAAMINALSYLNHINSYSDYDKEPDITIEQWIEEEEAECEDAMSSLIKELKEFKQNNNVSFGHPWCLREDEHLCLMYYTALNLYEPNGKYVTKDNVDSILKFMYAIRILLRGRKLGE